MVNETMVKLRNLIIACLVCVLLLAIPQGTKAQNGACPPESVLRGQPHGIYPYNTTICAFQPNQVNITNDTENRYPCDQYVLVNNLRIRLGISNNTYFMYVVPPGSLFYGNQLRIRFYLVYGTELFLPPDELDDVTINLYYYDSSGVFATGISSLLSNFNSVTAWYEDDLGINHYYRVYFIDQILNVSNSTSGGYVKTRLYVPDDPFRITFHDIRYSSIQIGSPSDNFPAQCSIPNAVLPVTPTPGATSTATLPPTWTPVPGATSTPTPIQTPGPTGTGIAPPPTWTSTPIVFPTIPSENTPTPWGTYEIPTVAFPTVDFPAITWPTPAPTILAGGIATQEASMGGLDTILDEVAEDWLTRVAFTDRWANPDLTVTGDIPSPAEIGNQMAFYTQRPFSYIMGLREILPNSWPYVLWGLGLALFVVFNFTARLVIRWQVTFLEIVRRIWEMIPFN